jgi:hypothetical protein
MGLSEIAAGLVTVERQHERGVAVVDRTDRSIAHAIEPFVDAVPCEQSAAVRLVTAYMAGQSVQQAAKAAGIAPITAVKTLHLLGFEGLNPLSPLGREILHDWLQAEISRADALALTDVSETEFAIAAYIETHSPFEGAAERIRDAGSPTGNALVEKREALGDTMSDADSLR